MATPNFSFENRCIVVTNEDIDCGNCPKLGCNDPGALRSYPSREIEETEGKFNYYKVVMTSGYYEAACIDYKEKKDNENTLHHLFYYYLNAGSKRELFRIARDYGFKISDKVGYAITKGVTDILSAATLIDEYLMDKEEAEVNKRLDKIKEEYGYTEYLVDVKFSNGETWYKAAQ